VLFLTPTSPTSPTSASASASAFVSSVPVPASSTSSRFHSWRNSS